MSSSPFSQADLDRITAAVNEAESKTSGEIVPYFTETSDDYRIAHWRGGALFAGLTMCVLLLVQARSETWLPLSILEGSGLTITGFFLGFLLVRLIPSFKRLLIGHSLVEHRVSERASLAFLSEEVFKTRERTGIMIYLSFFERKVVVLGDSGINTKVKQSDWDGIVHALVKSIKENKMTDGIVEAIRQCGSLLQQHGVARRADDTDELRDDLRIGGKS
jgi:putative membrane protein